MKKRSAPDKKRSSPPKKRNREATTRLLLDAATSVFAKRGYDAATTKEISLRARVNEALIQRYFGGKAGLLTAILEEAAVAYATTNDPVAEDGDLKSTLRSFFVRRCEETREHVELKKIVFARSILDPKIALLLRRRFLEPRRAIIARQLAKLQSDGRIRPKVRLKPLAHSLASLAFGLGFFDRLVLGIPEPEIQKAADEIVEQLVTALSPR